MRIGLKSRSLKDDPWCERDEPAGEQKSIVGAQLGLVRIGTWRQLRGEEKCHDRERELGKPSGVAETVTWAGHDQVRAWAGPEQMPTSRHFQKRHIRLMMAHPDQGRTSPNRQPGLTIQRSRRRALAGRWRGSNRWMAGREFGRNTVEAGPRGELGRVSRGFAAVAGGIRQSFSEGN